ncbi:hypothetical protein MXB_967 [Myxobolus squamalis]|nr:hypothetical protein MXB_967 [Myxobolus squamalis]
MYAILSFISMLLVLFRAHSDELECKLCLFVGYVTKGYLSNNESLATLATLLFKVCDNLAFEYREECRIFVNAYVFNAIQEMANQINVYEACRKLELCDSEMAQSLIIEEFDSDMISDAAINLLYEYLTSPESDIDNKAIELICGQISENQYRSCETIVANFLTAMLRFVNNIDPRNFYSVLRNFPKSKHIQPARARD